MSYGWKQAPADVREQIAALEEVLQSTVGTGLVGLYLHGSLAMGSFQPERSDIDLIAVCRGDLTFHIKKVLTEALLRLSNRPNPIELHICTIDGLHPWRHPCPYAFHYSEAWRTRYEAGLAEGGLAELAAFAGGEDSDLAAHIRVLRERGVTLQGRRIGETFPPVPDADYFQAVLSDVDVPFREVSRQPVYYVLNLLRAIRFAADGAVLSKEEAGVWGMSAMPLHIEVVSDALKLYRRPEPRESLHFDVEPLQAFVRSCRRRLPLN